MQALLFSFSLLVLFTWAFPVASQPTFPPDVKLPSEEAEWLQKQITQVGQEFKAVLTKPVHAQPPDTYKNLIVRLIELGALARSTRHYSLEQGAAHLITDIKKALVSRYVRPGMPKEQARDLIGTPEKITEIITTAGVQERWVYQFQTILLFENRVLKSLEITYSP